MTQRHDKLDAQRRRLLQASLLAGAGAWVHPLWAAPTRPRPDAVVSLQPRVDLLAPTYASVGEAIAAAPVDGRQPFRILVTRGRWREKLVIDRPHIYLIGEDRAGSVVHFDAAAGMPRPDGEPWGTWGCASVIVRAADFHARN
ncbi:MAG TPA: hypothetical protein VIT66_13450, partial [Lysobacter sp.]